jgi:hypothetical protein
MGLLMPSPNRDHIGIDYLDEIKYEGQSKFLKDFYKGTNKPNF